MIVESQSLNIDMLYNKNDYFKDFPAVPHNIAKVSSV